MTTFIFAINGAAAGLNFFTGSPLFATLNLFFCLFFLGIIISGKKKEEA